MGHYAAEMRPEWFEGYVEPKKGPSTDQHWVIDLEYNVVHAIEFQKNRGQFGYYERMMRTHYKKRSDAVKAAIAQCEKDTNEARLKLMKMKHILKVERPWETDK